MPALLSLLTQALAAAPPGSLAVALSGGHDSTVLLHALADLPIARARGLRAVHVDHALHADSGRWAQRCADLCAAMAVEFVTRKVRVDSDSGVGLEAAARDARYAALADELRPGELLLTAQHRDDQAETVLLKLLRGAGPEGLGAMRQLRPFSHGYLFRPLLDIPQRVLQAYALRHRLQGIEDPSNANTDLSRNFLRREILPRLRTHWTEVDAALAHAAQWNQAASAYLDAATRRELAALQGLDPRTLRWQPWLELPAALRDPALRLWLRGLGLPEPTHRHVQQLIRQLKAPADKSPCVDWPGAQLRRYRQLLYASAPCADPPAGWHTQWTGEPLQLPAGCGILRLLTSVPVSASNAPVALRVGFRSGGEALKPVGGNHQRDLRTLFQEAGVPPWQRGRIPLIHAGAVLLAVGDIWISVEGAAWMHEHRTRLSWVR